jgi:hypothetical protein
MPLPLVFTFFFFQKLPLIWRIVGCNNSNAKIIEYGNKALIGKILFVKGIKLYSITIILNILFIPELAFAFKLLLVKLEFPETMLWHDIRPKRDNGFTRKEYETERNEE